MLEQVETGKHEYPYEVNEMPVKTRFFYHVIMTSSIKCSIHCHQQHDDVNDHTGKNVKAMKAGYGKKEVGEIG